MAGVGVGVDVQRATWIIRTSAKRRKEITRLPSPLLPMSLNFIVNLSPLVSSMKGDEFEDQHPPPASRFAKVD
jgi:hypothetical protein